MADCEGIMHLIKENSVGVEIGVYKGDSSEVFLKKNCTMFLIDPYVLESHNPGVGESMYHEVLERLKPFVGKFIFLKTHSENAIDTISLVDFVFVDGNHSYESVKKDLNMYWEKVKKRGILCGDDYGKDEVKKAVDEFILEHPKQSLKIINEPRTLWTIIKGEE